MTIEQINEYLERHSFKLEPSRSGLALYSVSGNHWTQYAIVDNPITAYGKATAIVQEREARQLAYN